MSPSKPTRPRKPASTSSSPDTTGFELDARRAARTRTAELLRSGRTALTVIEAAGNAAALADASLEAVRKSYPPPRSACQAGCDWCCHLTVGTVAPEVIRIVDYLRQTLSVEEWQMLRERVARLHAERRGRQGTGIRLPCALLAEHRCLAYPVRPQTCRGFNSRDARSCERFLTDRFVQVPAYGPQVRLHTFVLDGVREGLTEAKLSGDLLELTAALYLVLETPDAVERWLAGEAVFAPARIK